MNTKDKLYYFAHPYTNRWPSGERCLQAEEANFRLCCIRSAQLIALDYKIYAPICHYHSIQCSLPEFIINKHFNFWYDLDFFMIDRCKFDGIILAPGWEESVGCVGEYQKFKELGLEILSYVNLVEAV